MKSLINNLLDLPGKKFQSQIVLDLLNTIKISAQDVAAFTHYSSESYTRNLICKNRNFELLLLCWEPGQLTPIHDHAQQKCWMTVVEGIITSENYDYVSPSEFNGNLVKSTCTSFTPGENYFIDDNDSVHLLRNPLKNNKRTMTLHLYAKPFSSCMIYDLEKKKVEELPMKYHSVAGILCSENTTIWAKEIAELDSNLL